MTENELILSAIKEVDIKKQEALFDFRNDAIKQIAQQQERKKIKPKKSIKDWSNRDFLNFIRNELKTYGCYLARESQIDLEHISRLYDKFVGYIGTQMDNTILKRYMEWWIDTYGRKLSNEQIYVTRMMGGFDVEKFLKKYKNSLGENKIHQREDKAEKVENSPVSINAETLFDMSGLSAVLISCGIVKASIILKNRKVVNPLAKIGSTLQTLSKNMVEDSLSATINNAPYEMKDIIDFISIAKPACQQHGIKQIYSYNYREYFKS